jgi:hypothetical protein
MNCLPRAQRNVQCSTRIGMAELSCTPVLLQTGYHLLKSHRAGQHYHKD